MLTRQLAWAGMLDGHFTSPCAVSCCPQWPNGQFRGLAVALPGPWQAGGQLKAEPRLFAVARPLNWPFGHCGTAEGLTKRTSSSAGHGAAPDLSRIAVTAVGFGMGVEGPAHTGSGHYTLPSEKGGVYFLGASCRASFRLASAAGSPGFSSRALSNSLAASRYFFLASAMMPLPKLIS
jgi:hypothetical protein